MHGVNNYLTRRLMNKILPIILVVVLSGYIKNVQAESIQAMQDIKPLMTTSEVIEIMGV